MSENGHVEEAAEGTDCSPRKIKVDPGNPTPLAFKRKVVSDGDAPSSFTLSYKEMLHMAPIGLRLWRHIRQESAKGKGVIINPFLKHSVSSTHGVPLGGIGSGSIGRSMSGKFQRWQLFPQICEDKPVFANQFSVVEAVGSNRFSPPAWLGASPLDQFCVPTTFGRRGMASGLDLFRLAVVVSVAVVVEEEDGDWRLVGGAIAGVGSLGRLICWRKVARGMAGGFGGLGVSAVGVLDVGMWWREAVSCMGCAGDWIEVMMLEGGGL